jgi:hypothetical protein
MTVRYHQRGDGLVPDYWCNRNYVEHAASVCHKIPGASMDAAVGKLLGEAMMFLTCPVKLNPRSILDFKQVFYRLPKRPPIFDHTI